MKIMQEGFDFIADYSPFAEMKTTFSNYGSKGMMYRQKPLHFPSFPGARSPQAKKTRPKEQNTPPGFVFLALRLPAQGAMMRKNS